ncbi:MFS general substrate transporter [Sistotremastrum niveocremeum HHB9708]|uniref:MFS general substrate transporter n=1 Tax=Sistotremastrum niveocremeum HHB9708 TaxID=1314777 RepID=A0A164MYR3_9AGAM|nr:MFS general substrate transporter [Sistotremastrum niveocremeum HHB9708]
MGPGKISMENSLGLKTESETDPLLPASGFASSSSSSNASSAEPSPLIKDDKFFGLSGQDEVLYAGYGGCDFNDVELRMIRAEERRVKEKELVMKLDCWLLPCLVVIYIMNYIDRTAITSARLKGLEHDLHLTDLQFDTVLAALYVSFIPAQIISNMILNRVSRPSFYISCCVILWGLTSACTAVTRNYHDIMLCRIFIGIPEAAFYPGAVFLLSRWYTRKELAFRSAILYFGSLISNAFGSLIAAGILANMEGQLGLSAWRWLFIIEGFVTIVVGVGSMYILPDYPNNTEWLTLEERKLACLRLTEDGGEADKDRSTDSAFRGLIAAISDYKVWIFAVMMFTQLLGLSFTNFFPTLTASLGFSTTISLLLAAPPWIFAAVGSLFNARHADRTGERFFHLSTPWIGTMIGFVIALVTADTGARYVSMFLMAGGKIGFALTLVWVSNVVPRPPAKRAAAIGVVNGLGNLGSLVGAFAWKKVWGPLYHPSMWISLIALMCTTLLAILMRSILIKENKKLDEKENEPLERSERERIQEAATLEGISFREAAARKKGFRYLY